MMYRHYYLLDGDLRLVSDTQQATKGIEEVNLAASKMKIPALPL